MQHQQQPRKRIKTAGDAVCFIDSAGFCMLFPVKNVALTSLYSAMTGRAPIEWDLATEKLWKWKDELPQQRRAFYSKYFKGRGTFISLKMLPYFLAMEGTALEAGGPARLYERGRVSADGRALWEALENHGALATLELRQVCGMETVAGNKRYKRAILQLARALVIVHSGVEQETGAWASSRFELTVRAFAKEARKARHISREAARAELARKYLAGLSGAGPVALARLFGWTKAEAAAAMR